LIVSFPYTVVIKFKRRLTIRARNKGAKIVVREREVFVGIDVHREICKSGFCEGSGPTGMKLKHCGTTGKPGGKRRKQTSICISEETGLPDSTI